MIDIASFHPALRMKWVKSYLDDQDTGEVEVFFQSSTSTFRGEISFLGKLKS